MSLCKSPLTLIEEAAHSSCRSTTASKGCVCVSPSVWLRVCLCEGETCWAVKPVRTSTRPLQPGVCCYLFIFFKGSHSAFSRWFPAGLPMTCDNITVLKGQAWREPVGGLVQSQRAQSCSTTPYTHTHTHPHKHNHAVCAPYVQKSLFLWLLKQAELNSLPPTG